MPGGCHGTATVRPENGLPAPRVGPLGGARGRVCVLGVAGAVRPQVYRTVAITRAEEPGEAGKAAGSHPGPP